MYILHCTFVQCTSSRIARHNLIHLATFDKSLISPKPFYISPREWRATTKYATRGSRTLFCLANAKTYFKRVHEARKRVAPTGVRVLTVNALAEIETNVLLPREWKCYATSHPTRT